MHNVKNGQRSTYFIKRELEQLFDLPQKATTSSKVVVTTKKHRHPVVVPEASYDFVLAALIADAK